MTCCESGECPFDSLDEKIEIIIKAMQVLQKWIDAHEKITDHDTNLFDNLNRRLQSLEETANE